MELETCGNSKKVQLWFWGPILKYRMYSTKESNGSCIKKKRGKVIHLAGAKIPPVLRASNRLSLLWRVQQLSFQVVLLSKDIKSLV